MTEVMAVAWWSGFKRTNVCNAARHCVTRRVNLTVLAARELPTTVINVEPVHAAIASRLSLLYF